MKRWLIDIICFLFVLLFIYAAASKLLDYQKFRVQLGQSPILTAFAGWVAWMIPAIEIAISVMLAVERLRLIGLYASFSLMTMFTTYIVVITKYSEYVPCSCGGILQNMTWNQHLVFNIVFTILAVIGILLYSKQTVTKVIDENISFT
ncbi:MAG: MauE/DoxX family redox-associated membrane protein [Bacteroidota bacterium]